MNLAANTFQRSTQQVARRQLIKQESVLLEFGAVALGSPIHWYGRSCDLDTILKDVLCLCISYGQRCITLSNAR